MRKQLLLLCFLFIGSALTSQAQKIEFGGGLGFMHYKGDITPNLQLKSGRPAGNLFFRYNASKALSGRFSAGAGRIYGSDFRSKDPFQLGRGYIFGTRMLEAGADLEYNFLDFDYTKRKPRNWSPYVFAGLAFYNFKPDQEPTESYRKSGLAIPFGLGIKWQIKGPWSLGFEFGTRKTWSDYLDGHNESGPAVERRLQTDPTRKDMYYYSSISLSYTILRVFCP
ncbi:DUF6089 family protein [Siphonobacter sp. SORGH_AS_0500]|uniref:type IX secretion system protein PorG n=1 Tax=Siphonobacter sp. SORGH_AS_0500 TaxID=1864824 RepID=UPI000CCA684D|nr:DUF6089 family protein [Siphonobacter sp. SORGH_AS_0500]MDR6195834.1 hypothetical protein [Siphonobacter sp. SORGH_AS_0500]PKK37404.1 hypothetical protein BWI96_05920 [Siphonobacter sp. SORGH_AS_0500]